MKQRQPEQLSLKYYRDWTVAKDVVKDATADLSEVVKAAAHALDVAPHAFKLACKWQREPETAVHEIRHLKRLAFEFGLTDKDFNPVQLDLIDAIDSVL